MATIFLEYFYWHYTVASFEIFQIMQNYLKATWHRFLIIQHFKTLFSPWHRQNPSDFGPKESAFTDKILNAITDGYIRIIAAGIRSVIIFTGLIVELFIFLFFIILIVLWLVWPALSIYLVMRGLTML